MKINLCLACRRVNRPEARLCVACGASLSDSDTVPMPLQSRRNAGGTAGALWLNDIIEPRRAPALAEGDDDNGFSITLRDVDPAMPPPSAPQPTEELVDSGPPPAAQRPVEFGTATADRAAQRALKAERRAGVRRARLRQASAGQGSEPVVADVLVLESDPDTRAALCSLLEMFGFVVHAMDKSAPALLLVASRPLAAAFVGIDLDTDDGSHGLDRCKRLSEACRQRGGDATVLVGVAAPLRPMDRVRAELAGCDEAIVKPVTRGGVAHVFDVRGIAMPRDARQS